MAYFPNGASGDYYQEKWCFRCVNWGPDVDNAVPGCAVWDLHLLYNGEESMTVVLDRLIPMQPGGIYPARCNLFHEATSEAVTP